MARKNTRRAQIDFPATLHEHIQRIADTENESFKTIVCWAARMFTQQYEQAKALPVSSINGTIQTTEQTTHNEAAPALER